MTMSTTKTSTKADVADKVKSKEEGGRFIIKGLAYWAHLHEVNEMSGKYQIDLIVDAATKKELLALGVVPREYQTEKSAEELEKSPNCDFSLKTTYPVKVVDAHKRELSSETRIGNGSLVNVVTHIFDRKAQKGVKIKPGKSLGLDAVQVITLVEYQTKSAIDAFDEVDGYEAPENGQASDEFRDVEDGGELSTSDTDKSPF